MDTIKSLNLPDQFKNAVARGIFDAVTCDLPEQISEQELPTSVGSGLWRWNYINRDIERFLGKSIQYTYQKRGAWKFLLLFDPETAFTFSIMSEPNFKKLQTRLPQNPHYIEALTQKNSQHSPMEGQIRLQGCERQRDISVIDEIREQLMSDFSGIIENHILILFDSSSNIVTSVRALLLTPHLEIVLSENWSRYLSIPYKPDILPYNESISSDEDILVSLKDDLNSPDPTSGNTFPQKRKESENEDQNLSS